MRRAGSAIVPTSSTPRALLNRRRSTNTPSCAKPGCSADATLSTTEIRRGSARNPMMNPPSDQNPMAMKIPFYALFALLIPLAHAPQPAVLDLLVEGVHRVLRRNRLLSVRVEAGARHVGVAEGWN